jgi:D-alanyl-D-alanine dipeptidase
MSDLQDLCERPIPDMEPLRQKRGYRSYPIDATQPLYNEPLVDIATLGIEGLNHYSHADNPPYYHKFVGAIDQLYLRKTVAMKLAEVDKRLRENGIKLFVYDAYRPTEVQAYAHDVWMPAHLKKTNPELEGAALVAAVEKFWAAPTTNPNSPAPHKTGGAVDLTVIDMKTGQALPMGTAFDETSELSQPDSLEAQEVSDPEVVANRRILYWAMVEAGFASHPREWWHFSYGDQLWAQLTEAKVALYGSAELPVVQESLYDRRQRPNATNIVPE